MEDGIVNAYPTPELRKKAGRALIACGFWLRVAFVGASGVVAGLIQLIEGSASPLSALTLAVGGAVLAVVSWWRARAALDHADKPTARLAKVAAAGRDRALAGS